MPLFRRLPKRGFNPLKKAKIAILNLGKIQTLLNNKKIKPGVKINIDVLKKANIVGNSYTKFKVLGSGTLEDKLEINADYISKSAKEKLDKVGGSIILKNKK